MAYKQQPFIFHRYGDWRLKIRVPAFQVLVEVLYQVADCWLLLMASDGRRNKGVLSGTSFIKALVSFIRALPSWFNYPKGPPNTIMLSLFNCSDVSNSLWPPRTAAYHASLTITIISLSLLKLMSIELVMPSNHLILCHPLLLLPSIFPSIRVFSSESAPHIRWPKYWSFSFSITCSNEYTGSISFRVDWFDLLAIQGTLKSLLQLGLQHMNFGQTQTFTVAREKLKKGYLGPVCGI